MRALETSEAAAVIDRAAAEPTVFIECTETFVSGINTGIQRVVRNIILHASAVGKTHGFNVVPVGLIGGSLVFVDPYGEPDPSDIPSMRLDHRIMRRLRRQFRIPAPVKQSQHLGPANMPDISRHILLLLDACWHLPIRSHIEQFRKRGGQVISVTYDLIPVTHPQFCDDNLVDHFKGWIKFILENCSDFIAISRSTANEMRNYIISSGKLCRDIDHFYLGSDLDLTEKSGHASHEIISAFNVARSFLIVGSIEPRKNHAFALDAFERYWAHGGNGSLIIIGKQGWKNAEIIARIKSHQEYGFRLHQFRNASDDDLSYAYQHASALILPSIAEGFGLPIVEASGRKLPVICSDIPVFREIANETATFFNLSDHAHLTDVLLRFEKKHLTTQPWMNWRKSTEQLFKAIEKRVADRQRDASLLPSL